MQQGFGPLESAQAEPLTGKSPVEPNHPASKLKPLPAAHFPAANAPVGIPSVYVALSNRVQFICKKQVGHRSSLKEAVGAGIHISVRGERDFLVTLARANRQRAPEQVRRDANHKSRRPKDQVSVVDALPQVPAVVEFHQDRVGYLRRGTRSGHASHMLVVTPQVVCATCTSVSEQSH